MPTPPASLDLPPGQGRVIRLAGVENVRDLGGLPTAGGGEVRRGRLFRGAWMPRIGSGDLAVLRDRLHLRSVLDLRSAEEVGSDVGRWSAHGIAEINHPFFEFPEADAIPRSTNDFTAVYAAYLERSAQSIVGAAALALDPDRHPLLFHCAAGKDRTGVLTALLLDAIGVPHESIAADYALHAEENEPVLFRLAAVPLYAAMIAGSAPADHRPEAKTMLGFLAVLRDRHGGSAAWLRANGVAAERIDRFRDEMGASA